MAALSSDILDAMLAADLSREQIVALVKAHIATEEAKAEARREQDAERQRRKRQNSHAESRGVTRTNRDGADADEKSPPLMVPLDKEIPPTPPKEINPPLNPPTTAESARAKRLPEDFTLPDSWRNWAVSKGLSQAAIDEQFLKMRNWSQYAKNGACRDWYRRWQNWISEAPKDATHDNRNRQNFNAKPQFSGVVANLRHMLDNPEDGDRGGPEPAPDNGLLQIGRRSGAA